MQKNKSKHIEINTDLNIQINYNENEMITKLNILNPKTNKITEFKERDIKEYEKLLKNNTKPKSILIPFNKENILIDDNYISCVLKDEHEFCNYIQEDEEEEEKEEEKIYKPKKKKIYSNSYIGKLQAMFDEDEEEDEDFDDDEEYENRRKNSL